VSTLHIVGAGLAGLSTAVAAKPHWPDVRVYEAAPHAGGRCRSFYDKSLDCLIDNGNHLILGAYEETLDFARAIGSLDTFNIVHPAEIPFAEPASGREWLLRPNRGPIPFSLLFKSRRVPETTLSDLIRDLKKLALADSKNSIFETLTPSTPLFKRLWEPLTLGILNTPAETASAQLFWAALKRTLLKGEQSCRPYLPHSGLSASLIEPAIDKIGQVAFNKRLKTLEYTDGKIKAFVFNDETVKLASNDAVVLALPPEAAQSLLPDLIAPKGANTILNLHFKLEEKAELKNGRPFLGLVGTTSQWVFVKDRVASVTVSAANDVEDPKLAETVWGEISPYLQTTQDHHPPHKIIREKRATFDQTPENTKLRPPTTTDVHNLFLASDWIDTGLPATIESAIVSGRMAEAAARRRF